MSPGATPPGRARRRASPYGRDVGAAQSEGLLALTILVAASLVALVYAFLRMAGVIGRHARRDGRAPPPTPLG